MNLVDRAQKILMQPKQEWYVIQQEPTYTKELYTGYIIPLAAIGPAAMIIGWLAFGFGLFALPIPYVIVYAVFIYLCSLGGVYVMALIIDALAPSFASQKQIYQALKLVAYSYTPAWLGGIFNLIPALAFLGVLCALYGFYLMYLGLPVMMQTPPDKAIAYIVVAIVVVIVVYAIIFAIVGAITAPMLGAYPVLRR